MIMSNMDNEDRQLFILPEEVLEKPATENVVNPVDPLLSPA
jgi:hypothetical protein